MYINSFDIVILLETHTCADKFEKFQKYFTNLSINWKPAYRVNRFGRAIGGCMFGINKNINQSEIKCAYENDCGVDIIKLATENAEINIYPLYIRGANWEEEFGVVENFFIENNVINAVVIGDLNVRIGEIQQTVDEDVLSECSAYLGGRKSEDKETNGMGKKFIEFCEHYGLLVANGAMKGDENGNLTFISGQRVSVNDICAVSLDVCPYIYSFTVQEKAWSDHQPICLSLKLNIRESSNKTNKLLPKFKWIEKGRDKYIENVKECMRQMKENNTKIDLLSITNAIKNSIPRNNHVNDIFTPKSPWFDYKCFNARNNSFKLLKKFEKTRSAVDKLNYVQANTRYKDTCKNSQAKYYKNLELKLNSVNDSKTWWKIARELRNQTGNNLGNVTSAEFRSYFKNLLNPTELPYEISYAPMLHVDPFLDSFITVSEITEVLKGVKINKAPGEDRIPYEFYKNAPMELLVELAECYNNLYNKMNVDETFTLSVIYPILKKGNANLASNYRGISFMNCIAKILMGIMNSRLYKWTEQHNVLTEYQAGFRKGYSTMDNIYNLAAIVHLKLNQKRKVYAFFVDFKAAFDKVSRSSLMYKLHSLGVSTKMVNFLASVYYLTKSTVWNGSELSEPFETISGVKQGCLLSPLLFSLYINDLHEHLGGGIFVDEINVRLLLYADDIVILSDDIMTLQEMINNLEKYCDCWNLEVNLAKSKIMVFRNGGRLSRLEKWVFKGEDVEIVKQYNYLGMILTPKMSFSKHIENRYNMAKSSINSTWKSFLSKNNISFQTKYHLFDAVSRSIQSYGAQVWGHTHLEEVNKLQRFFIKRILKLPNSAPNYTLYLESGLQPCHLYTLNLNLRYLNRTLFEYSSARLPHKLSVKILEQNIFWSKALNQLGSNISTQWQPGLTYQEWHEKQLNIINTLQIQFHQDCWQRALSTETFYRDLNFSIGKFYINNMINQNYVMWIFKARCDLISLNGSRFSRNSSKLCSLCNMREDETIQHFICRCPILNNFRLQQFHCITISEESFIQILDGELYSWSSLVKYIISALQYRKILIEEYNY